MTEDDVETAIEGLENLFMMVRAHLESGLSVDFDGHEGIFRWYDAEADVYMPHPFNFSNALRCEVTPEPNDTTEELLTVKQTESTWEMDWRYMPVLTGPRKAAYYPRMILIVDAKSGMVLNFKAAEPSEEIPGDVYDVAVDTMFSLGRPKSIPVCDDQLHAILKPLCRMLNVGLTTKNGCPS